MLEKLYVRFGKRKVWIFILGLIIILFFVLRGGETEDLSETTKQTRFVELTSLRALQTAGDVSWLGTVRSVSDVTVVSEADGVVTSVPVVLGQKVVAGQTLATLENASERASLLQAEGAYESALASARQSGVSVAEAERDFVEAKNTAKIEKQNTLTTINEIIASFLDQFYANEHTNSPSLRVSTPLPTAEVNDERFHFKQTSESWTILDTEDSVTEITAELTNAKSEVERLIVLVDVFTEAVKMTRNEYSDAESVTLQSELNGARTTLLTKVQTLNNTILALKNTEDALEKTKISAGTSGNTVADAQVKQALGALRQAQATYNKTIIKTPITGTINTLPVTKGTRISNLSEVAKVANNENLEVVTYLGENDLGNIMAGDEVLVDETLTGKITIISNAIDTTTGKLEVRIELPLKAELVNGKSVKVAPVFKAETEVKQEIPLSAVRFKNTEAYLLQVSDGKIEEKAITVGEPRGNQIMILSELGSDEEFVLDARGVQTGEEVSIKE